MIKSVTVTNEFKESLCLELIRPETSGFYIRSIDGLGPVKANINTIEVATMDGEIYNSSKLTLRNIVLSLGFLKRPTIEATRIMSYKFFPIKKEIKLLFETDFRLCEIYGIVESNTPDIFSQSEGCQISIICPDPYFYSVKSNEIIFSGIRPLFEFPFENDSLEEPLLELSELVNRTEENIFYEGDLDTGVIMTIHAIGEVQGLSIYDLNSRKILKINDEKLKKLLDNGIQAGDDIVINTIKGRKSINMFRNGAKTNIINSLERPIHWMQLTKGDNIVAYRATKGLLNLEFKIQNKIVYEGI